MFTPHPSPALNTLFAERPWQGADPLAARLLFIGLDANYAADIETSPIFPALLDYHRDGAAFWRRHGVHHPFLLPQYRGDGLRYHRNFAKIGFTAEHAAQVCFIELLHVPTVGRNALSASDFDRGHLGLIDRAIRQGAARHVFVSDRVLRLMSASGGFAWLPNRHATEGALTTVWSDGERRLYKHLHFSNYGKFEARLRAEADAILALAGKAGGDTQDEPRRAPAL
jgi:hypothetical protein